jgi:hypothetical protein
MHLVLMWFSVGLKDSFESPDTALHFRFVGLKLQVE